MIVFDQLKKNDPPLRVLTLVVIAGLLILIGGLWWVQVIMFHTYTESGRNQSYRTVRIPAVRGKILDRNGLVLAENRPSYDINLYIEELRPQFADEFNRIRPRKKPSEAPAFWKRWIGIKSPETVPVSLKAAERAKINRLARFAVVSRVVNEVSQIIGAPIELDEKQFHKHYVGLRALPLTIYSNLQTNRLARFLESPSIPPSIDLETQPMRYYPNGRVAAHLLGYLGKDVSSQLGELSSFNYRLRDYKGKIGLEGVFDADLRGKAGVKNVLVNNMGYRQTESIWEPAEPGKDIMLTIDLPLQKAAEDALYERKNVRGAVVVLNVNGVSRSDYRMDENLNVPAVLELQNLPEPILNVIQREVARAVGRGFAAPSRVAHYPFDNGVLVVENFRDEHVELEIVGEQLPANAEDEFGTAQITERDGRRFIRLQERSVAMFRA